MKIFFLWKLAVISILVLVVDQDVPQTLPKKNINGQNLSEKQFGKNVSQGLKILIPLIRVCQT